MRRTLLILCVLLIYLFTIAAVPLSPQIDLSDISLTVAETGGARRVNDPVTWGIPLSREANITSGSQLAITDPNGTPVPAQFTVLARWGGAPSDLSKPIKWVLADFQATLAPYETAIYHLASGSPSVHSAPIQLSETAGSYTVDTGSARFLISKTAFHLFDQVYINRDNSGGVNDALLSQAGSITATYNGITYRADTSLPEETVIEINGPLHTVLRVRGWLKDTGGANKLLAYTARIHFYAGKSTSRVQWTVWNDNKIFNNAAQPDIKEFGSPNTVLFNDLSINLQLSNASAATSRVSMELTTAPNSAAASLASGTASLYQPSSGGEQWNHSPENTQNKQRGFAINGAHTCITAPSQSDDCRTEGWLSLLANGGGISAGVRHFWQNYPKYIEAKTDGSFSIGLFPKKYGSAFELRVGEQKTHEVLFYFGAEDSANGLSIQDSMTALHHPLQAWASDSYYLNTAKVFQHFSVNAASSPDFADFEGYVDAGINFPSFNAFTAREGGVGSGWVYSPRPESWGWRNFGDVIAEDETNSNSYPVFTNLQYDHPWGYLIQAVRIPGRDIARTNKWWSLAESGALQTADIDIVHSRCTGLPYDQMNACMDPANPIPIGWAMGARLTNQHHADPSPDLHRHALLDYWAGGIRGMLYYYYFTGDGMVKDAWMELAENARWRIENSACNPDCGPGYANNNPGESDARLAAYGLEIMTDAYSATGNIAYSNAAQKVIAASHPAQTWFGQPGYFPSPDIGGSGNSTAPWGLSLIMKSLGEYNDVHAEFTGGFDPAAQDSLMTYARLMAEWWRIGEAEPTCYYIYENGGCATDYCNITLPDGLAYALMQNDGSLDTVKLEAVAREAWQRSLNEPWGADYPKNQFLTSKHHALLNLSGSAWMGYNSQPGIFADVPQSHWAVSWIETLYLNGITGGCSTNPLLYCPDASVTRAQMAIFILRGVHGSAYVPPPATGAVFADVPTDSFAADWIEQLALEGITAGCGGGNYCPDQPNTRAEMSIFLLRGKYGGGHIPPAGTGTVFGDVPPGSFAVDWIEQLSAEGITGGCGNGNYCPNADITRAEMAVFLVRAFNLK